MTWGEAIRLLGIVRRDPSSQLASAVEGWDYPLDRAGWMMADLIDVQIAKSGAKNQKPYPRPIKRAGDQHGNAAGQTREQVLARLAKHRGYQPPV